MEIWSLAGKNPGFLVPSSSFSDYNKLLAEIPYIFYNHVDLKCQAPNRLGDGLAFYQLALAAISFMPVTRFFVSHKKLSSSIHAGKRFIELPGCPPPGHVKTQASEKFNMLYTQHLSFSQL